MRGPLILSIAVLLLAAQGTASKTTRDTSGTVTMDDDAASPALDSLVASERAFSALSVKKGMREAFLRYLAEDGTIFRPLPVNGRKAWTADGPVPGTLIWEPIYAEVSLAGDVGFTTGPWEFRPPRGKGNASVAHGHFVSVWKRPPGGEWRVAADIGVRYPPPSAALDVPRVGGGKRIRLHQHSGMTAAPRSSKSVDVRSLDQSFERELARGTWKAFSTMAAADMRFNTDGTPPFVGLQSARAALDTLRGRFRVRTDRGEASRSRDLAYSYGLIERTRDPEAAPPDSIVYLHVWRRSTSGEWLLALAVWNPIRR